jgi:hypothetical protein
MVFTFEDARGLIRILAEHPELQAEIRPIVLSRELLELPAAVAEMDRRLQQRMDQLTARLDQLTARVDDIAAGLERLTARVDQFVIATDARLNRIEGRLGNHDGRFLELKYRDQVGSWFIDYLRRARAVSLQELEAVEAAVADGRISRDEYRSLSDLDLIVAGTDPETRRDKLIALEVSATINRDDVQRVADRADILRRAGYWVVPVVGGFRIAEPAARAAREREVAVDLRRWDGD